MAYNPGALEAALAAVVGDEPSLIAELRRAFFESAQVHVNTMTRTSKRDEWRAAATRLHSLAASCGAIRLMNIATEAEQAPRIDPSMLRKIERAIGANDL